MKNLRKLIIIGTLFLFCIQINAQNNDTLEIQRSEFGIIQYAWFKANESSNRKMQNDTVFLKSILKAKEEDSFHIINVSKDESGVTHKRFQQYYKGFKVENQQYLLHGRNDNIEVINGDFQVVNVSKIIPSLNEQQSLERAIAFVGAKKYKWEDARMEKAVKQYNNNPNATYYPKGELVISKDFLRGSNTFKLSWKFTISSMEPDNEQLIYVDANNGDIINSVSLICDSNTTATAQTKYSGTKSITVDSYPGGYRLKENRNNVNIFTLDLNNSTSPVDSVPFTNTSTSWINGSWSSFAADQWALDIHWAAEQTLDYWRTVFNRSSLDSSGLRVISFVHYYSNWPNAAWVGGTNSNYMKFGDGNSVFKPLASLDIFAHEFGHGIDDFTAHLTPGTYESGALREGFGDIWGACVEHWAAPSKSTWLIAEELFTSYSCLRNLQNPKSTTTQEGQHPDTYQGSYWSSNGDPHTNSTVLSHWFYLLSQGGSGTNDISNPYNVYGLGIDVAQNLAYMLEWKYLFTTANYSAAKNSSVTTANFLYGSTSLEAMQVKNAWYAVGIGTQPTQISLSGGYILCTSSTPYSLNDVPSGSTITWSCSNNISRISSQGSNPCYFQGTSTGSGWIQATITSSHGTVVVIPVKSIWVGKFESTVVTGTAAVCPNSIYNYTANVPGGHLSSYSYTWTYPSNWTKNFQYQNTVTLQTPIYNPSYGTVRVSITNSCGTSGYSGITVYPRSGCGGYFSFYPNPANDEVTLTIEEDPTLVTTDYVDLNNEVISSSKSVETTTFTICIYNNMGNLISTLTRSGKSFNIPLINIRDGNYILEVRNGKNAYRQQLIVKHN